MRSLVLFTIGGALLLLALGTGCKDDAAAKRPAGDPESAAAGAGGAAGQPDDPAPALPVPRRMRSGQSPDDGAGDGAGERRRGWRGERSVEMRERMAEIASATPS